MMVKFVKYELLFMVSFIICLKQVRSDIFSSVEQLARLPESQTQVLRLFREYIKNQHERLFQAAKSLENFESMAVESNKNPKQFMGHPVNAYLMVKRLTLDLNLTLNILNSSNDLENLSQRIRNLTLPTNEDYNGAIVAINRLQETYLLNASHIKRGVIGEYSSIRPLNAYECFDMGRVAHQKRKFELAIEWYNEALKQVEIEGSHSTIKKTDVLIYMSGLYSDFHNNLKAIEIVKSVLDVEPNLQIARDSLQLYKRRMVEDIGQNIDRIIETETISLNELANKPYDMHQNKRNYEYEALCRGDFAGLSAKRASKLKCRYLNHHPSLIIGPIKQEQVFDDPPIFVFYEVATDKQIKRAIEIAKPKINRALVVNPDNTMTPADYRISQSGWLQFDEDPVVGSLVKLASAVTKLDMIFSEPFQMNNYGVGGVYDPHHDFSYVGEMTPLDDIIGRRMATWMFYLEAPEMGGATVFPLIGAHVKPISRSAVLWYNLYPSLNGDQRTLHAACPVLVGSKWVSNLWIHSTGQEFRRPCNLVKENVPAF